MAEKRKSYLQIAREAKGLSREMVAAETNIDVSTLFRYEQNPQNIPPEVMNVLIDVIGDEYLGYLYLTANPVAMRFLPSGVSKIELHEAVVMLAVAGRHMFSDIQNMMALSVDGISEDEKIHWSDAKHRIVALYKAFIALECADGLEN